MRKYRNYTDNDVIEQSKQANSIATLLKRLNLRPVGGNYASMKRILQKLNVDTSHWSGSGWNAGKQLKNWKDYTRVQGLKKHLIKSKGNQCEECKNGLWLGQPIKLEVHHIDGDRTNNDLPNLQLLCPNCHSFTDNFRNKKVVRPVGVEPT